MAINLADLGLTQEDLRDRVVEQIADQLVGGETYDENGNPRRCASDFLTQMRDRVKKVIDARVESVANECVLPRVAEMIESIVMQETNSWGEAKKVPPLTFREYLVKRAEAYMTEEVDYEGQSKKRDSYGSWRPSGTRMVYAIHKHLDNEIKEAMQKALSVGNQTLAKALYETCRVQINEAASKFKVQVTT